ncbi:MAG: hypothetical protein ACYC8T_26145 [Myxococcaceae bacterium]
MAALAPRSADDWVAFVAAWQASGLSTNRIAANVPGLSVRSLRWNIAKALGPDPLAETARLAAENAPPACASARNCGLLNCRRLDAGDRTGPAVNTNDNSREGKAIDVEKLSVREALSLFPFWKLAGLLTATFAVAASAGWGAKGYFEGRDLENCRALHQSCETLTGTLQQAIAAGNCVKAVEIQRTDAARALVARLDVQSARIEHLLANYRQRGPKSPFTFDPEFASPYLDLFANDPRVAALFAEILSMVPQMNRSMGAISLGGSWELDGAELREHSEYVNRYKAAARSAREYLKAKYLPLDSTIP